MLEQAGECWRCLKSHMACLWVCREAEKQLFSAEEVFFFARKSLFSLHFDSDLVLVNYYSSDSNFLFFIIHKLDSGHLRGAGNSRK